MDTLHLIYYFINKKQIRKAHQFIFLGDTKTKVKKILKKTEDVNVNDISKSLQKSDIHILKEYMGDDWQKVLFPVYVNNITQNDGANLQSGGDGKSSLLDELKKLKKSSTNRMTSKTNVSKDSLHTIPERKINSYKTEPMEQMINDSRTFIYTYKPNIDDNLDTLMSIVYDSILGVNGNRIYPDTNYLYQIDPDSGEFYSMTHTLNIMNLSVELRIYNEFVETNWNGIVKHNLDSILDIYRKPSEPFFVFMTDIVSEIQQYKEYIHNRKSIIKDYLHYIYPRLTLGEIEMLFASKEFDVWKRPTVVKEIRNRLLIYNAGNKLVRLIKKEKYFHQVKSRIEYNISQCMIMGTIHQTHDLQNIFDSLATSTLIPYIKYTSSKLNRINESLYYTRISTTNRFNKTRLKEISKWNENKNSPNTLKLKVKIVSKLKTEDKYNTISLHTLKDGRTEIMFYMSFVRDMGIQINDLDEHVNQINKVFRKINKVASISLPKVVYNTIPPKSYDPERNVDVIYFNKLYNINGDISYKGKLIDITEFKKTLEYFFQHFKVNNKNIKDTVDYIYIRTNNFESQKQKRLHDYIRQVVSKFAKHSLTQIENITKITNENIDDIRKIYVNYLKDIKIANPMLKPKYSPNGIKLVFSTKNGVNQNIFLGVKNRNELHRLINSYVIVLTLHKIINSKESDYIKIVELLKQSFENFKPKRNTQNLDKTLKSKLQKPIRMLKLADPSRFGWTPNKGESNYSKLCQHQPIVIPEDNVSKLEEMGWEYDGNLRTYIKRFTQVRKHKNNLKKTEEILEAISLKNEETGKLNWYIPDLENNPKYPHMGFLKLDAHPIKMSMPCCYMTKQNSRLNEPVIHNNEHNTYSNSKGIYLKHSGVGNGKILKVGEYSKLPFMIDILFNQFDKPNTLEIKNNNVIFTNGYFIKSGSKHFDLKKISHNIINGLLVALGLSYEKFYRKIMLAIQDPDVFYRLYEGKIKVFFKTSEIFSQIIENNPKLLNNLGIMKAILHCPGVFSDLGFNIVIFKNSVDKNGVYLPQYDTENNLRDPKRKTIMFVYDTSISRKYFYPISILKIVDANNISLQYKIEQNQIPMIIDLYEKSFNHIIHNHIHLKVQQLTQSILRHNGYEIVGQMLDENYRLTHLMIKVNSNHSIPIPVLTIQGAHYSLPIYTFDYQETKQWILTKKCALNDINEILTKIDIQTDKQLGLKIVSYNCIGNKIVSVKLLNTGFVEIQPIRKSIINDEIPFIQLHINTVNFDTKLLQEKHFIKDDVAIYTNGKGYNLIHYQYFILHLHNFFINNTEATQKIVAILKSCDEENDMVTKKGYIKKIIEYLHSIKTKLKMTKQKQVADSGLSKFIKYCPDVSIDVCLKNPHCSKRGDECKLNIIDSEFDSYVNNIAYDIIYPNLRRSELLGLDNTNYISRSLGNDLVFKTNKNEILYSNINDVSIHQLKEPDFMTDPDKYEYHVTVNEYEVSNGFKIIKVENDKLMIFRALVYSLYMDQQALSLQVETKKAIQFLALVARNVYQSFDRLKSGYQHYGIKDKNKYIMSIYQKSSLVLPILMALSIDYSFQKQMFVMHNINYKVTHLVVNGKVHENNISGLMKKHGSKVHLKYWNSEKGNKLNKLSIIQSLIPKSND